MKLNTEPTVDNYIVIQMHKITQLKIARMNTKNPRERKQLRKRINEYTSKLKLA